MKRIIFAAATFITCAALATAQDFNHAATVANEANAALANGDFKTAIQGFKQAAEEVAQCTEATAPELLAACKTGISQSLFSAANQLVKEGKLDEAIDGLTTAIATAKEYACTEIEEKAVNLKQQVVKLYANNKIKAAAVANSTEEKIACYNDAVAKLEMLISEGLADAKLYIQKGQILKSLGKQQDAVESFLKAKDMGEESAANKQLSKLYLQEASSKLAKKDYEGAITSALKATEYETSATAYKIAGTAANASKKIEDAVNYLSKYLELAPDAKDAAQIKSAIATLSSQIKK